MDRRRVLLLFLVPIGLVCMYSGAWGYLRHQRLSVKYHVQRAMVGRLSNEELDKEVTRLRKELETAPVEFWSDEGDGPVYYFFWPAAKLDTFLTGRRVTYGPSPPYVAPGTRNQTEP